MAKTDEAQLARMRRAHTIARKLVRFCLRDKLEQFHGPNGITERQMKRLMIEVVNNVFTFLSLPEEVVDSLPEPEWNEPKLDQAMLSFLLMIAASRIR